MAKKAAAKAPAKATKPEPKVVRRRIYVIKGRLFTPNEADADVEVVFYDPADPPAEAVAADGRIVEIEEG